MDTAQPDSPHPDSPPPDSPPPDSKDWTWVLERSCPECGFRAETFAADQVGAMLRTNASQWLAVLEGPGVRDRPAPLVWSPLEYACHVRDVHRLYLERLELMLTQDGPHYPNWDQDETAIRARYHEADPGVVATELSTAAHTLADRFDQVTGDQWARTGHRSDGAAFTIETFAKYLVHDPIHHLHDVGAGGVGVRDVGVGDAGTGAG